MVLGRNLGPLRQAFKTYRFVPGRLEGLFSGGRRSCFVDYAHKLDALEQVLRNLHGLKQKRILTVSAAGKYRDRAKGR